MFQVQLIDQFQSDIQDIQILQFLLPYVIMCMSALLCALIPTCMDIHLKVFCKHKVLCTKNYNLRRPVERVLNMLLDYLRFFAMVLRRVHRND